MSKKPTSKWLRAIKEFGAAAFMFWITWSFGGVVLGSFRIGHYAARYHRGIYLSDNPIAFWLWSGFLGLATILVGGMAAFILWIAINNLSRK